MSDQKFLSHNDVDRLISAIPDSVNGWRDRCMLLMCFTHGLRVSELCGLRLEDVDPAINFLHIDRLKNGFPVEHPIEFRERITLIKWLQQRPAYLRSESPWLFLSRNGNKISRQQLYRLIRSYGERAGLSRKVHPHMLRHACGYALANRGVDTRLIQDYLGHKNRQNTAVYTTGQL
ncbi:tyrosine-type recombinase/integrase [Kalamiella sp. sgz302252]|uniref:tyrosine-type recombinase/integrase n=1 Tax=Pantoea sp. sgz302252 TaxID=3341827 RepID=UPI0036D3098B